LAIFLISTYIGVSFRYSSAYLSQYKTKKAYRHDDEDHLRILPGLHVCLSSSVTETKFDTSQVELRVLLDDLGFFVGDWTSTLDENCHELGDEVFCMSALVTLRDN